MMGDSWMNDLTRIGVKVRSAVNTFENNCLLTPLFASYVDLIKVMGVSQIDTDDRLK